MTDGDQSSDRKANPRADAAPEKMPAAKPPTPKPKANPRPPATKADIAAQKRIDKTVIKRMRKR
jgi:hypothetical protein